ncbi:MAG: EAL domain-containing protein [Polyangiaceae bacterium]
MTNGVGAKEAAVLVVDDDEGVLSGLSRLLTQPGVRVCTASSGAAALSLLAVTPFDVLVSDIGMPGITGLKLLHAVREHDLDLPVVLMTGNPNVKTAAAALEYGAFQYLIKPGEAERLRAVVQRATNAGRIARLKRECADAFGSGSFYVGDRAGVESKLNGALRSLWMAYQPIVRRSDGSTFAFEALLRSEEPLLPSPVAILRAAEKMGRVHDVGRAVRSLVAVTAGQMRDDNQLLFVNLHPDDLMDPALYLPSAPLSRLAARVVLELTDRTSLEDVADVAGRVDRLRGLGFRIAIDDVGAGQADPGTFNHLQPEFVKVDIAVVRGVDRDTTKRKIVRALALLCHDMGKQIIAEGVESIAERDALFEAGCDFCQGYLFGRPAPLATLCELVSES